MSSLITATLRSLRTAADAVRYGFPTTIWRKESGPGPAEYKLTAQGNLQGLALEPEQDLVISCDLKLAGDAYGELIIGQPLEATRPCSIG